MLARRLSNAEFDYTIRDLTGVDIRPTREFPVDPANEAGFDNSGESLAMSPALVKKYLAAARLVADHLVLKPDGFDFAPHPAVTDTDRDKYCVRRIIDFYQRHEVDYADYFLAAWRLSAPRRPRQARATLRDFAERGRLSARVPRHDLGGPDRRLRRRGRSARPVAGALAEAAGRRVEGRPTPGAIASGCATSSSGCGRRFEPRVGNVQVQGHLDGEPALRALEESPARRAADAVPRGDSRRRPNWRRSAGCSPTRSS